MTDVTEKVFMDVTIGGQPAGRMVFGLYGGVCPKTVRNFKELAEHTQGFGFKSSKFHRIIPGFMAQGGDFTRGDGTGGKSIYGAKFNDENFSKTHTKRGMLSMANAGPNTNGSQFFVLFKDTPWLDGRHVVFGEMLEGMATLDQIEKTKTNAGDRPLQDIAISDCGSLP